jgi:hypothetical protein
MSEIQPSPVTSDRDADAMEAALRRAAEPKPAEPDIAADDEGATAAAEEADDKQSTP